jgi:hypothetical protein
MKKIRMIFAVLIIVIVITILLSYFVLPFMGYNRITEGMTEEEVKNILGEPKYNQKFNMSERFFGYRPSLPENMTFMSWNYFICDQIVILIFVSPSDYSILAGVNIEDNLWKVVEKTMHPVSFIS